MKRLIRTGLTAMVLVVAAPVAAQAPTSLPEGPGPNQSIVRWAEGSYVYLADDGRRERGTEHFRMHVHPDGSRTLMMWHDLFARSLQYSVMLRVAANFRPLQAFANYWTDKGYKGSVFINVDGNQLEAIANGPVGRISQSLSVPTGLSIGTHPVSGDGWHTWHVDPTATGAQRSGALYAIDASNDLGRPVLGALTQMSFEVLGEDRITVPAGSFQTTRYTMAGRTDVWVMMPDRLVIKMRNAGRGYEYLLTEFASGNNSAPN